MTTGDQNLELRRIALKERNAEYYDAAQSCFTLYSQTGDSDIVLRGFRNLYASAWHADNALGMEARFDELVERIKKVQPTLIITEQDHQLLNAVLLEAEGWLTDPPNPKKLVESMKLFVTSGKITQALELLSSIVAFIEPEQQIQWIKYGIKLTEKLSPEQRDAYFILLIEPLILYAEGEEKKALLHEVFHRAEALSEIPERSHIGNLAVLKGIDLVHPYRIEFEKVQQIRQENAHDLVRSLATATHNRLRGLLLSFLGSTYYRMAEFDQDTEIRRDLYSKAKDWFIESVITLERTRAYGELLSAYTLAGTGFLSIAELEQDFEKRNALYRLGEEHLNKAQNIGKKTQLYHLRARAAINLGVALERTAWFEFDLERRKKIFMDIYQLQLEGKSLAEKTQEIRGAGYATMNASEMCGFLSDLETRADKKLEWANRQRELSQAGLNILEQTEDLRGQIVALSYAAFACEKLADLSSSLDDKRLLSEEMLSYAQRATEFTDQVPDPVATAYAYQKAGKAAQYLGLLTNNVKLLVQAAEYYEKAVRDWGKTGERHRESEALTLQGDLLLFQSGVNSQLPENERQELLQKSHNLHHQAAQMFEQLFFFHDAGENYWRLGQIHLLRREYADAQEIFDKVQKSFYQVAQLVTNLADNYRLFSTFGVTFVGLVDGLNIIERGNYSHAAFLFQELANELTTETERSLRRLRQLLEILTAICHYVNSKDPEMGEQATTQLNRLLNSLSTDAYEQSLPYGLFSTLQNLQAFLQDPTTPFPLVLVNLPLQEKMMAMAQTRHIVSTAMRLYQATTEQREEDSKEPSGDVIRSYVERISSILENR